MIEMICLTVSVFFVNTDVPQLKGFASDPQVQESFLRHMEAALNNSSQSGKIITFLFLSISHSQCHYIINF